MPGTVDSSNERHCSVQAPRKMRAHKKSRVGCKNCKLRKIKCDERKPACAKCEAYDLRCNYMDSHSPVMQVAVKGVSGAGRFFYSNLQSTLQPTYCFGRQSMLAVINANSSQSALGMVEGVHDYQFTLDDIQTLRHFHTRTIFTLGPGSTGPVQREIYRDIYAKFSVSHTFLLHIVLTVALQHEAHLDVANNLDLSEKVADTSWKRRASRIALHWSLGAALLNRRISNCSDLSASDRDALWACAVLLGVLGFASTSATTLMEAWPLKQTEKAILISDVLCSQEDLHDTSDVDTDLAWLTLCEGKRVIWDIADPLRPDSAFQSLTLEFGASSGMDAGATSAQSNAKSPNQCYSHAMKLSQKDSGMLGFQRLSELYKSLPSDLIALCDINGASTIQNNPYLSAVQVLAKIVIAAPAWLTSSQAEPDSTKAYSLSVTDYPTFVLFLSFLGAIHSRFKTLLTFKDPAALLLLALWYAKIARLQQWWVTRRAVLECQAICLFLERQYWEEGHDSIRDVVKQVRNVLGDEVFMYGLEWWA